MAKKATIRQLVLELAKERGLDVTDIDKISATGVKGKLEAGAGFKEAFVETGKEKIKSAKEAVSKKGIQRLSKKAYMTYFGGEDIFSAYMRGRITKKEKKEEQQNDDITGGEGSVAPLKIIAKESMAIPGMARDVNVMRQNLQKLVKIWGGEKITKSDKRTRKEDVDWFAEQDRREAEIEASRVKSEKTETGEEKDPEKTGGFLSSLISMFSTGFTKAISFIFNPKNLIKVFSKIFIPALIVGTLFKGFYDGFKKYQETGNFSDAIISGLGGMLKLLSFGIFGEETITKLFESIKNFFEPITTTISNIFTGIKDFVKKIFGMSDVEDPAPDKIESVASVSPKNAEIRETKTEAPPKIETKAPEPVKSQIQKSSGPTVADRMKQDDNLENWQRADGELQSLIADYQDEKNKVAQMLASSSKYPNGFVDDPSDPEYPDELKAVDAKYADSINKKKKEVQQLKNKPGVKEAMQRQKIEESDTEDLEPPTKTSGSKFLTTETTTTTGGQETIRKESDESKKARDEDSELAKKHAKERQELIAKLKSEGKITGKGGEALRQIKQSDEIKALEKKQESERNLLKSGSSSSPSAPSVESPSSPSSPPGGATGGQISSSSSEVAEGQRMESSADSGYVVNAPTNNSSSGQTSSPQTKASSAYNDDLAAILAGT